MAYSNHEKLIVVMLNQMLFKLGYYEFTFLSKNVYYLLFSKIIHKTRQKLFI